MFGEKKLTNELKQNICRYIVIQVGLSSETD